MALAAAFEVHCGARTGLPQGEPCPSRGRTRDCTNTCGAGEQLCKDGFWQTCIVPATQRSCSNTCGEGEQQCIDDAWLPCLVPVAQRPCVSVCGSGTQACVDGAWQACDAPPPSPPVLTATIRDFLPTQPDFAPCMLDCGPGGVDPNIVEASLGPDGTPVYAAFPATPSTHGQDSFDQWYHDVTGVNEPIPPYPYTLPFTAASDGSGTFVYDNEAFFPVDGMFFCAQCDEGSFQRDNRSFCGQCASHNYWFTAQIHSQILYTGGETYAFSSDDDLWVFINGHLAVDLGGVHPALDGSVSLDDVAGALGLAKGETFPLDLFYADRQPISAILTIRIPSTDIWSCP